MGSEMCIRDSSSAGHSSVGECSCGSGDSGSCRSGDSSVPTNGSSEGCSAGSEEAGGGSEGGDGASGGSGPDDTGGGGLDEVSNAGSSHSSHGSHRGGSQSGSSLSGSSKSSNRGSSKSGSSSAAGSSAAGSCSSGGSSLGAASLASCISSHGSSCDTVPLGSVTPAPDQSKEEESVSHRKRKRHRHKAERKREHQHKAHKGTAHDSSSETVQQHGVSDGSAKPPASAAAPVAAKSEWPQSLPYDGRAHLCDTCGGIRIDTTAPACMRNGAEEPSPKSIEAGADATSGDRSPDTSAALASLSALRSAAYVAEHNGGSPLPATLQKSPRPASGFIRTGHSPVPSLARSVSGSSAVMQGVIYDNLSTGGEAPPRPGPLPPNMNGASNLAFDSVMRARSASRSGSHELNSMAHAMDGGLVSAGAWGTDGFMGASAFSPSPGAISQGMLPLPGCYGGGCQGVISFPAGQSYPCSQPAQHFQDYAAAGFGASPYGQSGYSAQPCFPQCPPEPYSWAGHARADCNWSAVPGQCIGQCSSTFPVQGVVACANHEFSVANAPATGCAVAAPSAPSAS